MTTTMMTSMWRARALVGAVVLTGALACTPPPRPRPPVPAEVVQRVSATLIGTWRGELTVGDDRGATTVVFSEPNRVTVTAPGIEASGSWRVTGETTFNLSLSGPYGTEGLKVRSTQEAVLDATGTRFTSSGTGYLENESAQTLGWLPTSFAVSK